MLLLSCGKILRAPFELRETAVIESAAPVRVGIAGLHAKMRVDREIDRRLIKSSVVENAHRQIQSQLYHSCLQQQKQKQKQQKQMLELPQIEVEKVH